MPQLPIDFHDYRVFDSDLVQLDQTVKITIGSKINEIFDEYDWEPFGRQFYIGPTGNLLLVLFFPKAEECHYILIASHQWDFKCINNA